MVTQYPAAASSTKCAQLHPAKATAAGRDRRASLAIAIKPVPALASKNR